MGLFLCASVCGFSSLSNFLEYGTRFENVGWMFDCYVEVRVDLSMHDRQEEKVIMHLDFGSYVVCYSSSFRVS